MIDLLVWAVVVPFPTVSVTTNVPRRPHAWAGLLSAEVAPSPNVHSYERRVPVEESVNRTLPPVNGAAGAQENDAASPPGVGVAPPPANPESGT